MKILRGALVLIMVILISACATTNSDPHKPEMSVDRTPSQSKTFNQFHNQWENQ